MKHLPSKNLINGEYYHAAVAAQMLGYNRNIFFVADIQKIKKWQKYLIRDENNKLLFNMKLYEKDLVEKDKSLLRAYDLHQKIEPLKELLKHHKSLTKALSKVSFNNYALQGKLTLIKYSYNETFLKEVYKTFQEFIEENNLE